MDSTELNELVAVVTGGGSGIGQATGRLLSSRGAKVAAFDLDPVGADWPGALPVVVDVRDDASVRAGVERVASEWGRIDIVVNNAGISAVGGVEDNDDEEWLRVLDVHVVGLARVTRAALPHLRRSPAASIVNTSSIAATAGLPQRVLYSAAKGAVQAATFAMAADLVGEGIRVNCVNPGTVDTPWVERLLARSNDPRAGRTALEARQPLGRLGTAQEVASAIAYLAGPGAAFTTGTSLPVDGGMTGLRLPRG